MPVDSIIRLPAGTPPGTYDLELVVYSYETRRDLTVIGPDVADVVFPHDDPVGQEIRLKGRPFRVVGVLQLPVWGSRDMIIRLPSLIPGIPRGMGKAASRARIRFSLSTSLT